jgi:putative endonuclease
MRSYVVYILANQTRRLYIGITSNLLKRMHQHRTGRYDSYSRELRITRLVYFESTMSVTAAIVREKQLKRWPRARKLRLIELANSGWRDLCRDWFPDASSNLDYGAPGEG